jgi:hypothetical protein
VSTMNPDSTVRTEGTEVRGRASDTFPVRRHDNFEETKASFKTTELWLTLVGVVALIIVYNASEDPSLDLFRAVLLMTLLGMAYIVSRGLAKAGSWRDLSHDDNRTY